MRLRRSDPWLLILFGVSLFAAFMNLSAVLALLGHVVELAFPILLGLLLAFVLNVPMRGFEKRLGKLMPGRGRFVSGASLLLTLAAIVLAFTLAGTLLVPALVSSVQSLIPVIQAKWPEWIELLNSYEVDTSLITEWASSLDVGSLSYDIGGLLGRVVNGLRGVVALLANLIFGLVIAVYLLLSKDKLGPQAQKLVYAYLKEPAADRLCYMARLSSDIFAKFLSGQCVEAILLGCLIFGAFTVFRLPYAALTGFLTGLFAFIPYVGAFLSLFLGALLTLLVEPRKLLLCIIVYSAVQFIENQFIYPQVVGSSVGLAPLWTLVAALIGGKLFGLPGILFFIPLAAVVYSLLREDVNRRLERKAQKKEAEKELWGEE